MRKKIILAVLIIAFLFVLTLGYKFFTTPPSLSKDDVKVYETNTGNITSDLNINGVVDSIDHNIVFNESKGTLDEVHVNEGDVVEEGQLLFTYSNDELSKQKTQLDINLQKTQLEINQLTEKKEKNNKDLKTANNNGNDEIITQLEESLSETEFQLQNAYLAREELLNEQNIIESNQKDLEVYSDTEGIVKQINDPYKDLEERNLLTLSEGYTIHAEVSEYDIFKLEDKQEAQIVSKADSQIKLPGRITSIDQQPLNQSYDDETNYRVTLQLDDEAEYDNFFEGQSLEIKVTLDKKVNAVLIPYGALIEEEDSVYVVSTDNVIVKRKIELGIIDNGLIEVIQGLEDSEEIIFPDEVYVREGIVLN